MFKCKVVRLLKEILVTVRRGNDIAHEILEVQQASLAYLAQIAGYLNPQRTTYSHLVFTGATMPSNNSVVLNVGDVSQISVANFLADGVTPSNGVVSGISFDFTDPSATVVADSDSTGVVTGVAPSTAGPVTGSGSYTVTDTDGVVSLWNIPFTVLVNSVTPPPEQLTQSSVLVFSDPTPLLK